MFDVSFGEILLIFIVALLVVGPDKLPDVARAFGRGYAEFKKAMNDLKGTIDQDETVRSIKEEFRAAQRDVLFGQSKIQKVIVEQGTAFKEKVSEKLSESVTEPPSGTAPEKAAEASPAQQPVAEEGPPKVDKPAETAK